MQKEKIIIILGQTATGKSNLAVKIAKKINGEIISADSRQVYVGLDIGTGKITQKEMKGIPHHLIDIVKPKNKFTVAEYKKLAEEKIKEIISRDKTPIICGGTGFYIDAITKGVIFPKVPPNSKLRKILEKKSTEQLLKILKKLDPTRAKNIDSKNKVRLIRAIEIAKALGKVPKITAVKPLYKFIKIGLYLPQDKLKKKVEKRVKKMFTDGLLNEIKKLKKASISQKRLSELGFEYNNPTYEKVVRGTLQYAKHQMQWFKRDKEIKWFDASKKIFDIIMMKL
ncbi:tRNA (adenosine(37)-N6)-dimethylallyltransferase MiaA [Candidatus Nomurabacteria bacterium RIFOXYC2_FULL_36_19]|uniref:tRNA dimethylallyltransferase n=3 Tax=Candidatus Nomuraibacteriota TaxID=1752729 RepID=A0A1F6YWF8_9BACT|nr:MAG: tRNA dimethylallyltransferase [Candidatus Nomurabacteria bacterium GW2011_GWC2_35_8]OGJ06589.1 MAG: tRNA (adenosine(37)-N6)-dimethylallyltransferase MiaA [Candidatus Nomurabacteria bacterium RIFOXYA1_FULL_35_17]OGJ10739.1 MAG: tRNA (adenosine(37)-N6)-dimethylallyltransferase MiaA [Candidatus Nomurabacteria bacterium RIFOXYC2_FULL_36_19]OGJ13932.1 MAG: tRNA (adenosine(37)-N6)-dimethylallyltransferase MiaA [Candidatus Nomurabacteria bacterium RIFOXYD2_FULL_35_12]